MWRYTAEERILRVFNTFYTAHKCDFSAFADLFIKAYEGGYRRGGPLDARVVEELAALISEAASASASTLPELAQLTRELGVRRVYVVDCMGIPEVYALWCRARGAVRLFVNPSGVTQAFKDAFGASTMAEVAKTLGGAVVKRLDAMAHSDLFAPQSRAALAKAIAARMEYAYAHLGQLAEPGSAFISDHGYDVVKAGDKYAAAHTGLRRPSLAKLATVYVVKF